MTRGEVREMQWTKLTNLLVAAQSSIPFYRDWFARHRVDVRNVTTYEDFRHIPILTKDVIRSNLTQMTYSQNPEPIYENYTGGSTGEPLIFYQDHLYRDWGEALTLRHDRWSGWDFGVKTAILWGADRDIESQKGRFVSRLRKRYLWREMILNSFNVDSHRLETFYDQLRKFRPEILIGYANSLFLFASYLKQNKLVWDIPLRGIISAAETLYPYQRVLIEEVFGCGIYNRYGSRDIGLIASECSSHAGMHVCAENVFLEILRDDGSLAEPGEFGEVVVTGLNNLAMPLVRYAIGDVAIPSSISQCSCGRGLPLIDSVQGRLSDIIFLPNGKLVHGEYFSHLFYGKKGVQKFQVRQDAQQQLRVLLITDPEFDRTETDKILKEMRLQFGMNLKVDIEFVDEIPSTRTGKHRFTVSEVPLDKALRSMGHPSSLSLRGDDFDEGEKGCPK